MNGAVDGVPRALLRLEAAALLVGAVLAYRHLGGGWGFFAATFLLPDLGMLGYLAGPRWGARAYNLTHATLLPAGLLAVAWGLDAHLGALTALVWLAHVGFDRALGYGLKYGSAFGDTHLGRIGWRRRAATMRG